MTPKEINEVLYVQNELSNVPVKPEDAEFLYNFVKEKNLTKTLETGFAQGRSSAHIIAASNSLHTAMDPFQKEEFKNVGLENMKKLGMENLIDVRNEFSYETLPKLLFEGKKFEFIFIDGDHKYDGEFIDFFYGDLLLLDGGYILFHDTWLRSTQYMIKYIEKNRKNYKRLKTPLKNFCLFKKVGSYEREWLHFKEFLTLRSFFIFHFKMWVSRNRNTPIVKFLYFLKGKK